MLVRTLTRCAGKFNFLPGEEIELDDASAKELSDAGAVRLIDPNEGDKKSSGKKRSAKDKGSDDGAGSDS